MIVIATFFMVVFLYEFIDVLTVEGKEKGEKGRLTGKGIGRGDLMNKVYLFRRESE